MPSSIGSSRKLFFQQQLSTIGFTTTAQLTYLLQTIAVTQQDATYTHPKSWVRDHRSMPTKPADTEGASGRLTELEQDPLPRSLPQEQRPEMAADTPDT